MNLSATALPVVVGRLTDALLAADIGDFPPATASLRIAMQFVCPYDILLRVASLRDTLAGKIKAWSAFERRQSKRIKDLGDISRLVESHPELWADLPPELQTQIERPM